METKIIVAPAKGQIEIESSELPAVGPTQVLVETLYSAISPGTELAWLQNMPNTPGLYPYRPGYSACGRILEKGDAVDTLEVGQRVVCPIRHGTHGIAEASACIAVPASLSDVDAALYSLASIVLQGVRKAQVQLGWDVAVLGLGPIGNLAGQTARAAGATHVLGIDPITWRGELALQCGFDAVAAPSENDLRESSFQAVIEATGVPEAVPAAFQLAARMGHVILLASTRGETENVNFYRDVHKKGLAVIGAHASIRAQVDDHLYYTSHSTDNQTVLKLMASDRIRIDPLISDIVPYQDAAKAYDRLIKREEELMLIVFKWR